MFNIVAAVCLFTGLCWVMFEVNGKDGKGLAGAQHVTSCVVCMYVLCACMCCVHVRMHSLACLCACMCVCVCVCVCLWVYVCVFLWVFVGVCVCVCVFVCLCKWCTHVDMNAVCVSTCQREQVLYPTTSCAPLTNFSPLLTACSLFYFSHQN